MQVWKLTITLSESDRQGTLDTWVGQILKPYLQFAECATIQLSAQHSKQFNPRWKRFFHKILRLSVRKQEVCGRGGYFSMVYSTQNCFWSRKFEKTLNLNSAHKWTQSFCTPETQTQISTQRTLEHKKELWIWTQKTQEKNCLKLRT